MVTTTLFNGSLVRLGCKRCIVREVAGVEVEIGVAVNGSDDFVLDILVGFDHNNVSAEKIAEIRSEITKMENELVSIFGF
jgi:hypothetical protein